MSARSSRRRSHRETGGLTPQLPVGPLAGSDGPVRVFRAVWLYGPRAVSETMRASAAQLMVTRHIHRVAVVDDEDAPIGVISSLDLLRVLLEDPDIQPNA